MKVEGLKHTPPQLVLRGPNPKSLVCSRGSQDALKHWFRDLIKTPEISSKEPTGNDLSLENVQRGQCPNLAAGTLP